MSRQYDFEIADIADLKLTRGTNRKKIKADIPTYQH
jgi:hypothetical protein